MRIAKFIRISSLIVALSSVALQAIAQDKPQGIGGASAPLKTGVSKERLIADLETAIPRLIKEGDVTGLSIALIRDAEVVWHRGFGVKNTETKEPVDDNTVFEAASLSKPVFAYAVLKMAEGGKLDLDAPLSKYLPAPYIENDERLHQITARRVLSHTTGFPNWRGGNPLKIHFTPGEKFSYSGEGFVYLQKVVERLSGEPLDNFMRKTVFEPLRMTNSSYVWQERYESMKAYAHNSSGGVAGRGKPREANAAASLQTTALDYGRFVAAILKGGASLEQMLSPQVKLDESCTNCLGPRTGKLSESLSWGLGWGIQRTEDGDSFWHWGDNNGVFRCFVVGLKKQKAGVVIFTNSANGPSIVPEIVGLALGGNHPAFAWIRYEPYNSPAKRLYKDIRARGNVAIKEYREGRKTGPATGALNESQVNDIAYQLLRAGKAQEALDLFKMNAEDFPKSSNVYDSLAEAYMKNGNRELAIANYRKSLELNPQNASAARMLEALGSPTVKIDPATYDTYVGRYEAPFGIVTVTREGERLLVQAPGGAKEDLFPESETRFKFPIANATITFVKGDQGQVTHILVKLNGQDIQAKKIK